MLIARRHKLCERRDGKYTSFAVTDLLYGNTETKLVAQHDEAKPYPPGTLGQVCKEVRRLSCADKLRIPPTRRWLWRCGFRDCHPGNRIDVDERVAKFAAQAPKLDLNPLLYVLCQRSNRGGTRLVRADLDAAEPLGVSACNLHGACADARKRGWSLKLRPQSHNLELAKQANEVGQVTVVRCVQGAQVVRAPGSIDDQRGVVRAKENQQDQCPRDASISVLEWMDPDKTMVEPRRPHQRVSICSVVAERDEALHLRLDVLGRCVLKKAPVLAHYVVGLRLPLAMLERELDGSSESIGRVVGRLVAGDRIMQLLDEEHREVATLARHASNELQGIELSANRCESGIVEPSLALGRF